MCKPEVADFRGGDVFSVGYTLLRCFLQHPCGKNERFGD